MFTGRTQTVKGVRVHSLVLGKTDDVDDYCEDRVQVTTDKAAGIVRAAVAGWRDSDRVLGTLGGASLFRALLHSSPSQTGTILQPVRRWELPLSGRRRCTRRTVRGML